MVKINKHVEIVRSSRIGLSSMSQLSAEAILSVLSKHFSEVGITNVDSLADLEILVARSPDLVFLGMEYIANDTAGSLAASDKIWLSDFLEDHRIAYTGSGQMANELARNKHLAKKRVSDASIATAAYYLIAKEQPLDRLSAQLPFPLFVKPTNHGGGFGIDSNSVVHNHQQLFLKVRSITTKLHSDALVEQYLPGREFSVAVIKDEICDELIAMPIELIAPLDMNGARLLSSEVKSSNSERVLEVIDPAMKSKVVGIALAAFQALGASDYGRIDIRLDAANRPHFLEANLIPSLISGYGSFPKACALNLGLDYEAMIMKIVNLGLARYETSRVAFALAENISSLPFNVADPILDAI